MDQVSGFYIALLVVALVGILAIVNALLGFGLRWVGRRLAACWRRDGASGPQATGPRGGPLRRGT